MLMGILPLDDPRWKDLDHRNWRNGKRSAWTPDAPFVPDELAKLEKDPGNDKCFENLWPWLCSEGTTYAAAYAAVPYFVSFAEKLTAAKRGNYLTVVGLIVADSCPGEGESFEIKPYLATGYRTALKKALPLLAETLICKDNITDFRCLIGALAALKGCQKLANVLQDMDCVCGECPQCGESVYPAELQEAIC
jgi:hypothetical protein